MPQYLRSIALIYGVMCRVFYPRGRNDYSKSHNIFFSGGKGEEGPQHDNILPITLFKNIPGLFLPNKVKEYTFKPGVVHHIQLYIGGGGAVVEVVVVVVMLVMIMMMMMMTTKTTKTVTN